MRYFAFPLSGYKQPARLLLCFLFLVGCGEPAIDRLENYHGRLANVLGFSASGVALHRALPPMPQVAQWPPSGDQEQLNLLEFLSLHGCDLQLVIADQNASLGRFAGSSQKLLLQLRFLHAAPACIESLSSDGKTELAAQLQKVMVAKQQSLPAVIWKAMLGSEEARSFWKRPHRLQDYPEQVGGDPPQAIVRLNVLAKRWLAGDYRSGWAELEPALATLRTGDGGALLKAWEIAAQHLDTIGADLAVWQEQSARCVRGKPIFDPDILQNVVRTFFVGDVQVWAAQLSQRYYALMTPIEQLEVTLSAGEPDNYRNWRLQRGEFLHDVRGAMRRHVALLQQVMKLCVADTPDQR